ncbi:MAG: hypothetical protein ACFFDB_20120 [Promethearchaeota archaeon]
MKSNKDNPNPFLLCPRCESNNFTESTHPKLNILLIIIGGLIGAILGIWIYSALGLPGELWIYALIGFFLGLIGPTLHDIYVFFVE